MYIFCRSDEEKEDDDDEDDVNDENMDTSETAATRNPDDEFNFDNYENEVERGCKMRFFLCFLTNYSLSSFLMVNLLPVKFKPKWLP